MKWGKLNLIAVCKAFFFGLLIFIGHSLAYASQPQASVDDNKEYVKITCPTLDKLYKRGDYWDARGDWKSYSQSFAKELSHFSGAQWIGINVGKIVCIYQGKLATTFPVSLEYGQIVIEPKEEPATNKWSKNLGGYRNCISRNVEDCPVYQEIVKKTQDPLNEIKYFKDVPNYDTSP